MAHVVLIGALPESLTNFRGDLIRALMSSDHHVTTMAAPASTDQVRAIESLGANFRPFPVQRNALNPWRDVQTLLALRKAFRELKPDVVLAYTIKPVVWGGLAAFVMRGPRFYALIEGLGYAFQAGNWRRRLVGVIASLLYRASLIRADKVIFLNPDNKKFFMINNIVRINKAEMIDGIGLDVTFYSPQKFPEGNPIFLCIARLLREKGLREYAEAAHIVKERYPRARFRLVGPADPSPDGISLDEVRSWEKEGMIEYLGATSDVRPYLAGCHVYVLPSYHEGMPRTVLEAMAMARPILTTDATGCRETVIEGENGFLVPTRDANALAQRLIWFIENRDQWEPMGRRSRALAEERFDVKKINQQLIQIMGL